MDFSRKHRDPSEFEERFKAIEKSRRKQQLLSQSQEKEVKEENTVVENAQNHHTVNSSQDKNATDDKEVDHNKPLQYIAPTRPLNKSYDDLEF